VGNLGLITRDYVVAVRTEHPVVGGSSRMFWDIAVVLPETLCANAEEILHRDLAET
jgi:hypothetical protein